MVIGVSLEVWRQMLRYDPVYKTILKEGINDINCSD